MILGSDITELEHVSNKAVQMYGFRVHNFLPKSLEYFSHLAYVSLCTTLKEVSSIIFQFPGTK